MNKIQIRWITATLGAASAVGALAACSASSGHASITYAAWADEGGKIGKVAPYVIDGPNGAMVVPETVNKTKWEARVDGGTGPEITVTPASPDSVVHCTITDNAAGKVLDENAGAAGQAAHCKADTSTDSK